VKWLGFCDVDRVRLAYHAADVLVLPSNYEPWAVVVNEAMAAGLVVVASDVVGAAAEMVQDGRSGRLFPTGNLDVLTEVLMDATQANHLSAYKQGVAPALQAWRERADPVEGIRQALRSVGLLDKA
jgi:glycosyltransferase involved in cell wall biosynthesis